MTKEERKKEYDRQYRLTHKDEAKQYAKQRRLNNPEYNKEYMKQWVKDNSEYKKEYSKQWYLNNFKYHKEYKKSLTLSYHIVYLLPDHNYVGVTNQPYIRMGNHKCHHNRNTDNWVELARFNNREDALKYEATKHAEGYDGAKQVISRVCA